MMENKNILRTFCGCKPSKKQHWNSSKFYWFGYYKKLGGSGLTPRHRISKVKEKDK